MTATASPVGGEGGGALGSAAEIEVLRSRVLGYLLSRGLPRHLAEEVAQDTLLTLETKSRAEGIRYEGEHRLFAALRTASNKLLNLRKKKSTTNEIDGLPAVDPPAGEGSDPYRNALFGSVRHALQRLDEECRRLLYMKFFLGLSSRDIAARIDEGKRSRKLSENAVNIRSTRCLKTLRAAFLGTTQPPGDLA